MLQLIITDSKGQLIDAGDIVKLQPTHLGQCSDGLSFYGKVEARDGLLFPFDHCCYRMFEKVDTIPDDAVPVRDDMIKGLFRNYTDPIAGDDMHAKYVCNSVLDSEHFSVQ